MAVVVLVKGQHHKATAGQLNGIGVLHFRRVQIPVGHDDRGLGVVGRGVLRHIQKSAELTMAPIEADPGDFYCTGAAVEHPCQDTAQQDQHQRGTQQSPCAFTDFHCCFLLFFFCRGMRPLFFVSYGNYDSIILLKTANCNKNFNFHALVPFRQFCYTVFA